MAEDCVTCGGKGFALDGTEVTPCPRCNPDSGYEPGEYLAELVAEFGRCEETRGGGGRQCCLQKGHREKFHQFACMR